MKQTTSRLYEWTFYIATSFFVGTAFLRTVLIYGDSPALKWGLGLLAIWVVLYASQPAVSRRWRGYFPVYLGAQTALTFALLFMPESSADYFAILFAVLSLQIMQVFEPRQGAIWIAVFTPLTLVGLLSEYDIGQVAPLTLIYLASDVVMAFFSLTTRRAQAARAANQALVQELREANQRLRAQSAQQEMLAVARERNHLARELHDSVTQTIFSMTLTTQSALLLMDRDRGRVRAQLDRLNELAQGALAELRVLISELHPDQPARGGLAAALRQHLAERSLPEGLSISLEVEGGQALEPAEEQNLYRIAQEALNNVVKHAQTARGSIRLHLDEPLWMEISDEGQGFDPQQIHDSGRVGLASMRERAAEIGWHLQVITAPGQGTCIRVEKNQAEVRQI